MVGLGRGWRLAAAWWLAVSFGITHAALAQDAPPPKNGPTFKTDAASLERISKAVAKPSLRITPTTPRFYATTIIKPQSLAEYIKTWDVRATPATAPNISNTPNFRSGGNLDLSQIFGFFVKARRDAELVRMRERIELELRALTIKK